MKDTIGFKIYAKVSALFFAFVTLLPFVLLFFTSVRTMDDISKNGPVAWPEKFVFSNFGDAWEIGNFAVYYKNSVLVAVVTVVIVLIIALLGAYVFTFLEFHGKNFMFSLILLGLMIPFQQIMIPLFHTLRGLHLLNTLWAIILPQIAMEISFGIFLLRGFMRELPYVIIEAARLDGANERQTLFKIVAPLVKPSLVALLIFTAMSSWNNFMLPTIMIQKDAFRTVPVGLNYFKDQHFTNFPLLSSAAIIIIAPIVVIYLIFQKKMIQGMTIGSVKG